VREVAVIEAGDGKHSQQVKSRGQQHGHWTPAHPNHSETPQVQEEEWQAPPEFKSIRTFAHGKGAFREVIGIDPLTEGDQRAED